VVVVEDGEISGIVTESDVIRRIAATESAPADVEVDDIMTRDPETVEAGTPVEEALELMSRENLEHLPVVRGGEVAGIITSYEILDHVVSEKEYKHLRTLPSLLRKR
ncbi:MAG: cyclic nucleotide-binding/CBS domain-containing protein, partial [Candidatus Nanohaloarchaea archaeon]